MNKVERINNWGSCDQLDGVKLKDNELIKIKFPNGKENDCICKIESSTSSCGYNDVVFNSFSFVIMDVNGVSAIIKLAQDGILCERIEG